MIILTLLLGALPLCDDVEATAIAMENATGAELLTSVETARKELGFPLLLSAEADLALAEQQKLAAARLRTGCALNSQQPPPVAVEARADQLKAILDRPEFSKARDRNPDAAMQLLRRLGEWLEALLGQKPAQAFASGVRMFVLAIAAVAVGVIAWRLSRTRLARRTLLDVAPQGNALVLRDPSRHLKTARALATDDPRQALREALLALLSELERRKLARPDRVKTNRELALELPQRGASEQHSRRVRELLAAYDRTFYSLEPVNQAAASRFTDDVEALRRSFEGASA